jgi:myo-inositol 2-dehydrogenase / D-chiro-inositol 1-dehydrogenase
MENNSDKSSLGECQSGQSRREFIARASSAAMAFTIIGAGLARGSQANSKISLGLFGCGRRGTWIADLFRKHGGYEVTAAADYFPDRVNAFGDKYDVPAARRFTGLKGFKRVLDAKVDAVAIESPAYFHHEQAAAAVEAGVHVYMAKPVAVDVPGCRSVEASAKRAKEKRLAYLVDFQTRTDPSYQEAIRRVQKEASIGRIVSGEASYLASDPWVKMKVFPELAANPQDPELQLRGWGLMRAYSGDIITEQDIHSVDVMNWILDQHPLKALGTGGRGSRTVGDAWDNFSVIYWFPNDVVVTFYSKKYGAGADDIACQIYGTEGTIDTHYAGDVGIKGKVNYAGTRDPMLFSTGVERNIAAFHDQVTRGQLDYSTVAPAVQSTLTTILGRNAAYKQAEVTWDHLMQSKEVLEPHLEGLKD